MLNEDISSVSFQDARPHRKKPYHGHWLHDHEISDADINLIQDLQDSKRQQLLQDSPMTSGCLTWQPMILQHHRPQHLCDSPV